MEKRLFFSDNLKSFALLAGIIFHSAIIFSERDGYALKNREVSFWYDILTQLIHLFRMPLFFFLAGYFSEMVFRSKGIGAFFLHRIKRILVPAISGVLLFSPVESFYKIKLSFHDFTYPSYYFRFFSKASFEFSYIWFLWYLVIFTFLFLVYEIFASRFLRKSEKAVPEKSDLDIPKSSGLKKTADFGDILFMLSIGILFSFSLVLLAHTFFLKGYILCAIEPYGFIYYFSFFVSGVAAFRFSLLQFRDITKIQFLLTLVLIVFLFILYFQLDSKDPYWIAPFESSVKAIRLIHIFLDASLAWIIIFFLLAFFKKYLNFQNSFTAYLQKSSLPVFLLHYPVSIILGYYLVRIKMDQTEKFLSHFFGVLFFSFLIYDSIVKRSSFLNLLLGNKKQ